ncbi:hypothetical protein OPV22_015854 [Ensete ventricosum]|uniref:Ubiquitin carboxyl-terminal hydrolase n=1 Tax=Ensete ventricosum TaxID=4639 RepID=A0AAV8R6E0_ENSVE|nr:hypothetical protein OPV22_015854 [Ensete ventricosum]
MDGTVYLVPYRWWRAARASDRQSSAADGAVGTPYAAAPAASSSAATVGSDLVFELQRRDDGELNRVVADGEGGSGRCHALIRGDMWSLAIRWHNEASSKMENSGTSSLSEDAADDVYPVMLRVSAVQGTHVLTVKICKKDNNNENYNRACKLFPVDSEVVYIWDFSGQINSIIMNGWNWMLQDGRHQVENEILLEIQIYASSGFAAHNHESKMAMPTVQNSKMIGSSHGVLFMSNGSLESMDFDVQLSGSSIRSNSTGLTGLDNLGNTCFMNSAIQCLAHTPKLVRYFLGDYSKEINHQNPLGLNGELASAFGQLLRKLWAPENTSIAPHVFKTKLASFAPQFYGFSQHDCQELLAFLGPLSWSVQINFVRTMTVTVFSTDGLSRPSSYTVNVPKSGNCKDLVQALSIACSLKHDERLLVAEVFFNQVIRFLEDPSDSLSLIRDGDQLAAYRLSKDPDDLPLIVFMHQSMDEHYFNSSTDKRWKSFGVPLITRLPNARTGSTILDMFLKLLNPFLIPKESAFDIEQDSSNSINEIAKIDKDSHLLDFERTEEGKNFHDGFQLYLTDENCQAMLSKIEMDDSISLTGQRKLYVLVCWPERTMGQYDIDLLNTLTEVYKFGLFAKRPQESVSLYSCLEAFLKEEPLGPEDMWYCPSCKKHQQACKKLDLWRLPEVLIIHLKRFSYSRFINNKLEMFVDFPIRDLDLSTYIACKSRGSSVYRLYAVSNHYGNMGGGHYTAYIYHEGERCWYDFDDQHVLPISEDIVKSSAAYVLFYQRVQTRSSDA